MMDTVYELCRLGNKILIVLILIIMTELPLSAALIVFLFCVIFTRDRISSLFNLGSVL